MLNGYICSLEAMIIQVRERLADGRNPDFYEKEVKRLEAALAPVEKMREKFSKANDQWQEDDGVTASDASVVDAFALLEERYGQLNCSLHGISSSYNSTESSRRDIVPIMAAWNDQVGGAD